MDDLAMAKALRAHGEALKEQMRTMEEGPVLDYARATLQFCSDFLLAIATGDQAAKDALQREASQRLRELHPERDRFN